MKGGRLYLMQFEYKREIAGAVMLQKYLAHRTQAAVAQATKKETKKLKHAVTIQVLLIKISVKITFPRYNLFVVCGSILKFHFFFIKKKETYKQSNLA